MKEYVERAMAFAVLVDFPGELSPENIGLAVARKAIDALPAADVAEVRHGYWDDSLDGLTPYCSVCRCTHRCLIRRPIYCPNCGARMDKEAEQ